MKETTETKANSQISHENMRYGGCETSSLNKSSDIFSDNHVKPYNEDHEDDLRVNNVSTPFYLKNAKGNSNSDEDVEAF